MKKTTITISLLLASLLLLAPSCALLSPETQEEIFLTQEDTQGSFARAGNTFQVLLTMQRDFLEDEISPGVIDPAEMAQLATKQAELLGDFGALGDDLSASWGALSDGLKEIRSGKGWAMAGQTALSALLAALGIPVSVGVTGALRDRKRRARGEPVTIADVSGATPGAA